MSVWRIAGLSILGFAVPVSLAVGVLPAFFENSVSSSPFNLLSFTEAFRSVDSGPRTELPFGPSDEPVITEMLRDGFVELPVFGSAKPEVKDGFLVSVNVVFDRLPNPGQRVRVLMKVAERTPYQGWALGFKRQTTSLRPEVFWQDRAGKGGWLPFDDVELVEGREYTFHMLVQAERVVSVFFQQAAEQLPPNQLPTESLQLSHVGTPTVVTSDGRELLFAGGYSVTEIGTALNDRQLIALSPNLDKSGALIRVSQVFVTRQATSFASVKQAMNYLGAGTESIAAEVGPENIATWVRELPTTRIQHAHTSPAVASVNGPALNMPGAVGSPRGPRLSGDPLNLSSSLTLIERPKVS